MPLLKKREVAKELGISVASVNNLIKLRRLPIIEVLLTGTRPAKRISSDVVEAMKQVGVETTSGARPTPASPGSRLGRKIRPQRRPIPKIVHFE